MSNAQTPSAAPLHQQLADFGHRLETYRIARQLKQADLAEQAGLSRSTLARLESGKGGTLDSLLRVLLALGLEERLVDLVPDASLSPLAAQARPGRSSERPRKRVRDRVADNNKPGSWTWDDDAS